MPKALLFSDLHIHAHKDSVDRLTHCLQTLEWVFKTAHAEKVDHVLFLGDLFHERAKIDVLNYLRTYEVFDKYMTGNSAFDIWMLIGNHDMYHQEKWDVNSVKPLTNNVNIHIVDKPSTIKIGGVNIDFCPHTENPIKELAELRKGRSTESLHLLLGHMAVHGAKLNKLYGTKADVIVEYDNGMFPVSVDVFKGWKQVFLGHYHGAQLLSQNVEYVGSPLQLSFGEAFEKKHVVILDLETLEKKYVENTFSPVHYIIGTEQIDKYNLENNFVRIVLKDTSSKEMVDIKREIASKHKVASLDFKPPDKKEQDQAIVEEAKALLHDEKELMKAHVQANAKSMGLAEDKLLKVMDKICSKAKTK